MDESASTTDLPTPAIKRGLVAIPDQIFSSSPGFGTPAYPIASRPPKSAVPVALNTSKSSTNNVAQNVLPILLPPHTLRPVAFRTLTKKHDLTLTSSGLGVLSTFVGKFCGSGWREEGLAERVLDEIAKQWKKCNGGIIIEDGPDKKLTGILKQLEPCMSGGKVDVGKLSRTNSTLGGSSLSHQGTLDGRPQVGREDNQTSFGISAVEVEDDPNEDDAPSTLDPRAYIKIISAFEQPRFTYSNVKKNIEQVTTPASLLPNIKHRIAMFRNRYHLVQQRLMRNESFQAPSFSTFPGPSSLMRSSSSAVTMQQAYKITSVANLLGRSGSSHLLLGLLARTPTEDLSLTDLTGSVVLDLSVARPIPEDGAWFCPGMIVLVEGTYEEDGSNNSALGASSGVGGQIKGRFVADTIAGPPAERRDLTLGDSSTSKKDANTAGAGLGWTDFLGVGSDRALGPQMRRLQKRILQQVPDIDIEPVRSKILMVSDCHLDNPRVLAGIRAILAFYTTSTSVQDYPLSIVFMGNFVSAASMCGSITGGDSIEYKEHFDALSSVLSEFPVLLSTTTLVFVPGDNDPWASSFAAGAATALPRLHIPELFSSRVRRAVTTANSEAGKTKESEPAGETIWTSNPTRMSLFGPVDEIAFFRDDISGRFRRTSVTFSKVESDGEDVSAPIQDERNGEPQGTEAPVGDGMDVDETIVEATSHQPRVPHTPKSMTLNALNINAPTNQPSAATINLARKLIKTLLDQSHLAPFPMSIRPVYWDYASTLNLLPLPTALVLADSEIPPFAISYEGCHVMNPGRMLDDLGSRKGVAKWIEYDVITKKGSLRDVRF